MQPKHFWCIYHFHLDHFHLFLYIIRILSHWSIFFENITWSRYCKNIFFCRTLPSSIFVPSCARNQWFIPSYKTFTVAFWIKANLNIKPSSKIQTAFHHKHDFFVKINALPARFVHFKGKFLSLRSLHIFFVVIQTTNSAKKCWT